MNQTDSKARFSAKLLRPENTIKDTSWGFVILPKDVSEMLPRRGRTSVKGTINGHGFQATLDPDGQLSHWLKISKDLQVSAGVAIDDTLLIEISPMEHEPEPEMPPDLERALKGSSLACRVWDDTTTIARLDWIHWIESAKQAKTRAKRVADAAKMLAEGKKRVCCFDQSGFYSKSLSAPKALR